MIKVVVLGLVCVAGVGAIAAATSKPASVPIPSVVYPAVAGNKSDRLSLVSIQDIQPTVDQAALVDTPPTEPPAPTQPPQKEVAKAKAPDFIPRHWHDPNDTRAGMKKLRPEPARDTSRNGTSTKVAESQDCRKDGLGSLMSKLNLQPACGR
ncbi:hypothetical protein [Bradyrhizobium sp. B117]|uniref:hypothetical protein n=1 Tax=Bradyrhizobium sp. B117 TaxID=3140246 RepID=UPI0031842765